MILKDAIGLFDDETTIKIYRDGKLMQKGSWYEDGILKLLNEKVQYMNYMARTNQCEIGIY